MGIASPLLAVLSAPVGLLSHWLRRSCSPTVQNTAQATSRPSHLDNREPAPRNAPADAKPRHNPPEHPAQRPLRGNWPFTVNPQAPGTHGSERGMSTSGRHAAQARDACSHSARAATCWVANEPRAHGPKAVHKASAAGGGRLVIAGRMADVCAELDRMAASEAAIQAY